MYKIVITSTPFGDNTGEFETIIKENYFNSMNDLAEYIKMIKRLKFINIKMYIYKLVNNKYICIGDYTKYEQIRKQQEQATPEQTQQTQHKHINIITPVLTIILAPLLVVLNLTKLN